MLKISDNTIFYVACPASFQTGGTEALHVLAFELRKLGINAIMFYRDIKPNQDIVGERFKCFNIPYVFEIEDKQENILIVPEIWLSLLHAYKKIQKIFWWLSVDNYLIRVANCSIFSKEKMNFKDNNILHLAQSHYAWRFLEKKGVKRKAFLADYLRDDFFEQHPNLTSQNREDIILYNPAKGYDVTRQLIEAAPELTFVPLEKMTPIQVRNLCQKSKIYIDFGNHPGKDRFPREAAIQGNIVITGNKGSAAYDEDVPILSRYKINQNNLNIQEVISLLKHCLQEYDTRIHDFSYYRHFIALDKEKFIFDLRQLVGK